MSTSFELRIITQRVQLLNELVREVTGPGTLGEFGVLPDHIRFLTSLEIGVLSFKTDRATRKVAVRGGFAEVSDNVMTVLADDAVAAESVDPVAARDELQTAESQLGTLSPLDAAYQEADAARRWAQAKLDAIH